MPENLNIIAMVALAGLLGWMLGKGISRYLILPSGFIKIDAGDPGRG